MRRRYITLAGNVFMAVGIVLMAGGILVSIFSYLPRLGASASFSQGGLVCLFVGAFIWLLGASFRGRDRVTDRYWCIRRAQKMKQQQRQS